MLVEPYSESTRTVIDIHFFSIRSLTFFFSISIRFWRTALIEYFHMFHTIFVARILRFSQCKDNEGFLNTFWLNTWVSLQNPKIVLAKSGVKGWKYVFRLIDIIIFSINWKNYFDRSILVISMTVLESTLHWGYLIHLIKFKVFLQWQHLALVWNYI